MKIEGLKVLEIFDSRGKPTIEVELSVRGKKFQASLPSGKSTGAKEAAVKSFAGAKKTLVFLSRKVIGRDFTSIKKLDDFLIKLDGTPRKNRLGGNLILGISMAFSRAVADSKNKEVWQVLNKEFFDGKDKKKNPAIYSNLVNGGLHAKNNLDLQEYLVITNPKRQINDAVKNLIKLYGKLGDLLKRKTGLRRLPIGDEGGYAVDFKNNAEPLAILEEAIKKLKLNKDFSLGLDAAANNFWQKGRYRFGGMMLDRKELLAKYLEFFKEFKNLVSIEDPFAETDFLGFRGLKSSLNGRTVVGDDLTVTNPEFIKKYAAAGLINGVIIKPNQIGSVSEACYAIRAARERGVKVIVSHRSGETSDNFIIHLARACSADGVKIGAPVKERVEKFDELLKVYAQL